MIRTINLNKKNKFKYLKLKIMLNKICKDYKMKYRLSCYIKIIMELLKINNKYSRIRYKNKKRKKIKRRKIKRNWQKKRLYKIKMIKNSLHRKHL
jgi:hypothetical protein